MLLYAGRECLPLSSSSSSCCSLQRSRARADTVSISHVSVPHTRVGTRVLADVVCFSTHSPIACPCHTCVGKRVLVHAVCLRTLVHLSTHTISICRVIVSHACREACSVHTACFAALHMSRTLRAGSWSPHWWWRRLLVNVDPCRRWVPSSTPTSYNRATGDCPGNLQPPTQGDPALPSQLNET